MSMIKQCAEPGCGTLTMGPLCLEHELLLLGVTTLSSQAEPPVALTAAPSWQTDEVVRTASERAAAVPVHR